MGFSTHLEISGNPEFEVKVKAAPLAFQVGGEGSLALSAKPISGHVEQIPIRVRVPFLKHNHGYVVAASIGPFGVHLHEIDATVRAFGVDFGGVIGKEGIDGDLAGGVRCCMQVDVQGKLPGKVVEAAIKAVLEE
jgi:hypothetical protein